MQRLDTLFVKCPKSLDPLDQTSIVLSELTYVEVVDAFFMLMDVLKKILTVLNILWKWRSRLARFVLRGLCTWHFIFIERMRLVCVKCVWGGVWGYIVWCKLLDEGGSQRFVSNPLWTRHFFVDIEKMLTAKNI